MRVRTERVFAAISALALLAASACTSSETSVTAPTAQKCSVTASASPTSFSADGGSGAVTVSAARDCTWSLAASAGWVAVGDGSSGHSGQGDARISYSVASNPQAAARNASLTVGSESVQLSQAAAPCRFSLSQTSDSIAAAGGALSVGVTTLAGCSWSASSSASWVAVTSAPSAANSATVTLGVSTNTGPARVGQVNVAGQIYTVNQSAAAGPSPSPSPSPTPSPSPEPGGGVQGFAGVVTNASGKCPDLTFTVGDRTVVTDKTTKFKDISCGDVAKGGRSVIGEGPTDSNNVIHADIVQKWSGS